jgi:carboxyl-terminal processing protease
MIKRLLIGILLVLLNCGPGLPLRADQTTPSAAPDKPTPAGAVQTPGVENGAVPAFHPVSPGPLDGRIAYITADLLEKCHYSRQPFDASVAGKFLDHYLETLDPEHRNFLQSDLAEFQRYRTNLDRLTVEGRRGIADTAPGCEIFNRYVERLEQKVAYVEHLLKTEKFHFDTQERILLNRHELPYPKDLDEAKKLWKERLEFEYLTELLGKVEAKKKAEKANATNAVSAAGAKTKSDDQEIVETLIKRYQRNLHSFVEMNNDDVLQIYLNALAHVYDPHSDFMGASQLESFAINMNLSLFGIGAELTSEDGYCKIRRLLPGGPAAKSKKMKENDRLVAVAQSNAPPVDIVDMRLDRAVQLIRGPKGTEVRLTVIPAGADASARKVVTLIRDEIKLEDQEAKAKIIDEPDSHGGTLRLGIIDLPSFYAKFDPNNARENAQSSSTTADVSQLLTKMKEQNVDGVVLDLRRNGGGSLEEAIRLTGLFIKEGPVVQVRQHDGVGRDGKPELKVQVDSDTDPSVLYDGPLIVLTSRFSASASEIVAGALQDYGRALVVGESSTHGKGTVQAVNPLRPFMHLRDESLMTNDPGALKLTIKKFYRISGASTQLKGVQPDIVLPSRWNEAKDVGEGALDNPLPWDTIPSAVYDHLNRVAPYLPELQQHSTERIATNRDFDYVREDIELFKKQQADKTVSLNEQYWLKEKAEADAREKARDKERLARKEAPETVYELTVKQAAQPGMPPPVAKTNSAPANLAANSGAAATNSAAAGTKVDPTIPFHLEDESDEEKPPAVDVELVETEHILVDYLSVLGKDHGLTAGQTQVR